MVTIEDLKQITGLNDDGMDSVIQECIDTAKSIIEDYIGYSIDDTSYDEVLRGYNTNCILLKGMNVRDVVLKYEGVTINDFIQYDDYHIALPNGEKFERGSKIEVSYKSGWANPPSPILLAIKFIAGALYANTKNRDTIEGTSYPNGSITYKDNTKYYRYLPMVDKYNRNVWY